MRFKSAVLALGIAAVCTGLTGTNAAAYDNSDLEWQYWIDDTGDCDIESPDNDYCHVHRHPDQLDPTFFLTDPGGKAIRILVYKGSKTVAQVEFHPYDEVLYVYDGANDGDSIYVRLVWDEGALSAEDDNVYGPGATSAEVDYNRIELDGDDDIDEGTDVKLRLYDDAAGTDEVSVWKRVRA